MELSPGDRQPSMVCAGAEVHWGADQGGVHSAKGLCHRHQLCDHCHQPHCSLACHGRDEGRGREGSTARRFLHCPGDQIMLITLMATRGKMKKRLLCMLLCHC